MAIMAAAASYGNGEWASSSDAPRTRRLSSIVTFMSEQKWSLLGFDVLNRGTGRPATNLERLWEFTCATINMLLQYYMIYHGKSLVLLQCFGIEGKDISQAHKMLIMFMFLENQIQATLRSWFVFQSSVFSGFFSSFMVFVAVRGGWYLIISVTAFTGNGCMSARQILLWSIPMLFFQILEAVADIQLSRFVTKKKQGTTTNTKKVMREQLWAYTRHPNHLGFMYWWPPFAYICTNNTKTAIFYLCLTHFWILFQGIATNEGHMMRNYGQEYITYMDEVPMLWPVVLPSIDYRTKLD
jgi:protein-S-isoprenylcysteine O-methyltransferase Ste14